MGTHCEGSRFREVLAMRKLISSFPFRWNLLVTGSVRSRSLWVVDPTHHADWSMRVLSAALPAFACSMPAISLCLCQVSTSLFPRYTNKHTHAEDRLTGFLISRSMSFYHDPRCLSTSSLFRRNSNKNCGTLASLLPLLQGIQAIAQTWES